MASQNDHFVRTDQSGCLSLYREWKLDWKYAPLVISNIILLDGVNPARAFVPSEYVDIAVLKYYSRHRASLLVEIGNPLPPVHVDWVSLTALEDPIDRPATYGIYKVTLVCQSMGIPALVELCFFRADFIFCVVHKHTAWDVGKTGIKTPCNQNISISETDGNAVRLQAKVVGYLKDQNKMEKLTSFLVHKSLAKS